MKRAQIYISSAVFIVLTVIRIAFPTLNSELVRGMHYMFELEEVQTADAVDYGRRIISDLADGNIHSAQGHMKCLMPGKRNAELYGNRVRQRFDADVNAGTEEKEKSDILEAFFASQSQITDKEIPQSVMLEIADLGFEYTSPVEGIKSSGFGYRIHPITGELKFHFGTDFAANTGTPVKAFADGTVIAAGDSDSYGKYVIIDHGNGYTSLYAHCSELCVSCGEIGIGDTIALVGETGLATGPHLHFEIRHDGIYLNPEFYL